MAQQINQITTSDIINDMDDIPDSYCCPITRTLMKFPVLAEDGNTYEKSAIEQWINSKPVSPMDNITPLSIDRLVPNRGLKDAIDLVRIKLESIIAKKGKEELEITTVDLIPNINLESHHFRSKEMNNIDELMITIKASDPMKRYPAHICCTIDTSGSMGREAIIRNESGASESNGLNLLDIVKHGVRTIIENLEDDDYISIVSYSNNAMVIVDMMKMTKQNKALATKSLNKLQPDYQTNFWDGLSNSLKCIEKGQHLVKNSSIFILTDGQPNIAPPKGNVKAFQNYLDRSSCKCSVNTYAFGFYDIDSEELNKIAKLGNGTYNYIPDSSMVGTTFVNTLSNILTTFESNTILKLSMPEGVILDVGGYHTNHEIVESDWGCEIKLGCFHYGQEKNILITLNRDTSIEPTIGLFLNMDDIHYRGALAHTIYNREETHTEDLIKKHMFQKVRFSMLNTIKYIIDTYAQYKRIDDVNAISNFWKHTSPNVNKMIEQCQQSKSSDIIKYGVDMRSDYIQITEAIAANTDAFKKWGCHYLKSLYNAHLVQECNNFKDPGVQYYGGEQFAEIRDKADEIFCNLPAPEPTIQQPQYRGAYGGIRSPTTPSNRTRSIDMSSYYNSRSVCFGGACLVTLKDGSKKEIKDIKKGDILRRKGMGGRAVMYATVRCLVKSQCYQNKCRMVQFTSPEGCLLITEYHPMLYNGNWIFPCSLGKRHEVECDYIYNLVLEDNYGHGDHIVEIGGFECVTMGHNYTHHVVKHEYFGSQNVVEDLKIFPGFNDGLVELEPENIRRGEDNRICGIKPIIRIDKECYMNYNADAYVRNNIEFNGVGALFSQ